MKLREFIKKAHKGSTRYAVTDDSNFRLKDIDPDDTAGLTSESISQATAALQMELRR